MLQAEARYRFLTSFITGCRIEGRLKTHLEHPVDIMPNESRLPLFGYKCCRGKCTEAQFSTVEFHDLLFISYPTNKQKLTNNSSSAVLHSRPGVLVYFYPFQKPNKCTTVNSVSSLGDTYSSTIPSKAMGEKNPEEWYREIPLFRPKFCSMDPGQETNADT